MSADPRSGSRNTSPKGTAIMPMAFRKVSGVRSSSAGRLRKFAMARMNPSLANSEGWMAMPPMTNQRSTGEPGPPPYYLAPDDTIEVAYEVRVQPPPATS